MAYSAYAGRGPHQVMGILDQAGSLLQRSRKVAIYGTPGELKPPERMNRAKQGRPQSLRETQRILPTHIGARGA